MKIVKLGVFEKDLFCWIIETLAKRIQLNVYLRVSYDIQKR
jgi:hypothetical protein